MSEKTSRSEEEIDLGQLFVIIGKGFGNVSKFLGSILSGTLQLLVSILLFFKEHLLKFAIAGFVGLVMGLFIDLLKEPVYSATMEVRPNMQSGRSLYKNIAYYNELAEQKDSVMLAEIFKISLKKASTLRSFEITPIVNENQILSTYDEFLNSIDSVTAANMEFEDYKNNFFFYDYQRHIIKVESSINNIFSLLGDPLIFEISNNEFYKIQQDAEFAILAQDSLFLSKSLNEVDTLRKVYMEVMTLEAKKENSQGTNINMAGTSESSNEVDLFLKENEINNGFSQIKRDKVRNKEIVSVISKFEKIGAEKISVSKRNSVRGAGLAVLMVFLVLIGIEFNGFLDKVKK
jgi:hypothetical protein